MYSKNADKLQIGDIVMINKKDETNAGKQGVVCEISRMKSGKVGRIYLKPFNCEFKFNFPYSKNCVNKDGLPGWHPSYLSLKIKNARELSIFDIEWLKATRLLLGLSMEDVADIMHTTKGTISRIEAGLSNTKKSTILLYELVLKELIRTSSKK